MIHVLISFIITAPHLKIIEQPRQEFRFRYKTEVKATYGAVHGESSTPSDKTYPTVQLFNFNEKAVIRCSLYQTNTLSPLLHAHKLITRPDRKYCIDPHMLHVSPDYGMIAEFRGISISHTPRKEMAEVYATKKLAHRQLDLGRELTIEERKELTDSVSRDLKEINLNRVCLGFEAFTENEDGSLVQICDPVYTHDIKNLSKSYSIQLIKKRFSVISCLISLKNKCSF